MSVALVTSWIGFGSLALITLPVLCYLIWSRSRFVRLVNNLPGPSYLPFLGNFLELNVDHGEYMDVFYNNWGKKFGNIYRFWAGYRPMVVISSPELMEPILSSPKLITKSPEYNNLRSWLGNCILLLTGTEWKNRRRLLTPAFHFQILNSFMDIFNDQSLECARLLEKAIEEHGGSEFNVSPHMTQCALDILCETSMGRQTRSQQEKAVYFKNLHRIVEILMARAFRPWLTLDWAFKLSALGRENQRCVKALHSFTNQVIRDRREAIRKEKEKQSMFSEEMLNNNVQDEKFHGSKEKYAFLDLLIREAENGADLSDDDIRGEVDTFMFAGHDTVSLAMSWFLHCIAKHPEKQDLVIEELDQVFGDSDRPCATQDIVELKYLECCIKESLRLYPSVPVALRCLTEDVELDGYTLPAGVTVACLIYGMHRSPKNYPDPESFKPERFLPENSVGRHPYAYIPFSAGPRNCIGQKHGLLEMKVVLANLLRRFRFTVADPSVPMIMPSFDIVLKPRNGISLVVTKRIKML